MGGAAGAGGGEGGAPFFSFFYGSVRSTEGTRPQMEILGGGGGVLLDGNSGERVEWFLVCLLLAYRGHVRPFFPGVVVFPFRRSLLLGPTGGGDIPKRSGVLGFRCCLFHVESSLLTRESGGRVIWARGQREGRRESARSAVAPVLFLRYFQNVGGLRPK